MQSLASGEKELLLQKRKSPKLSTQTFTDPKTKDPRSFNPAAAGEEPPNAAGCLPKSPTSKTPRPKEERLSDKWGGCLLLGQQVPAE